MGDERKRGSYSDLILRTGRSGVMPTSGIENQTIVSLFLKALDFFGIYKNVIDRFKLL